jgi:DnaK suppressor protein
MTNTTTRKRELRKILIARQHELQGDVQHRIREGRMDRVHEVGDEVDRSDGHVQSDIELALLQLRTETLMRINQALIRLDLGTYGDCSECEDRITERRLRALPFAVRCQKCEERREQAQGLSRQNGQRHRTTTLFPDLVTS